MSGFGRGTKYNYSHSESRQTLASPSDSGFVSDENSACLIPVRRNILSSGDVQVSHTTVFNGGTGPRKTELFGNNNEVIIEMWKSHTHTQTHTHTHTHTHTLSLSL